MKKNRLSAVLAICMGVIVFVSLTMFASGARILGDLDGDGSVRTSEARTILRVAVNLEPAFTGEELVIADVDGNGKIQTADARLALRVAVELDTPSEIEESTTEAPSEEPSGEHPTEPTEPSEPAVTDPTDPSEPAVTDPTDPSEPAVTDPTDPSEPAVTDPTEPEEPTDPASPVTMDDECYIKATAYTYADGTETVNQIESAHQTYTQTYNGEETVLNRYFMRSSSLFEGHDVGMMVEEVIYRPTLSLNSEKGQDMYIINFDENTYLCLGAAIASVAGGEDLAGMDMSGAAVSLRIYNNLDEVDYTTEEVDGVSYYVVASTDANGNTVKDYLHQVEGRDFYEPAIVEVTAADGTVTSRLVIEEYNPDPSSYFVLDNFSGNRYDSIGDMINYTPIINFMQSIGMDVSL